MSTMLAAVAPRRVIAIAAHPDDIEFMMGGTLCLLVDRGWEAHYVALANGYLGSVTHHAEDLVLARSRESEDGARALGATWHPSLVNDGEIVHSIDLVRRVTSIIREIRPSIVLTQAPDDYMEDHTETSRIATTATFNRNMRNFQSTPPKPAYLDDVTVYHAQPHGLHDQLRRLVLPGIYVDISTVMDRKRSALSAHKTQESWLDGSQGLRSPSTSMTDMAQRVGSMSGRSKFAEGWRRHSHLGFSRQDIDPLTGALHDVAHVDEQYERLLRMHPGTERSIDR